MLPTVLLFDIDGTLIDTGGAGRRSMERAFAHVTGRADACSFFSFDGMTDRAIVRRGLEGLGAIADDPSIDRVLAAYLDALVAEVAASTGYITHPGVDVVLDRAAKHPHIALGLGTGNVRDGARIKLDRVRLFDRFSFGGFGCDHEERASLLHAGARRGAERLGKEPGDCRIVVIGDTPKDIAAARAIGAESLAVATGRFVAGDLREAGATFVCDNLLSPGVCAMLFPDA
ncbi:HAD family hydrolase [Polyangium sp. 6x1]|uniref:HAD family hydrolase n=1 Tax=Polyangium sp. 6x1 TaxID=3042689 RepID=UPI002482494D|nr:HAD family hydrolase [Polyangium sp. 6x1]MDI1445717.1 haloacid dehalogenase-like hydrolase [Polyangium sp. 6x1]